MRCLNRFVKIHWLYQKKTRVIMTQDKKFDLEVEKRTIFGRKVKNLRREGILPANIYGQQLKSQAVQVGSQTFHKVFKQVGSTGLVDLKLKGSQKKNPALIHNVQVDPISGSPIHVDFRQVDLTKKIKAQVSVEMVGESPAVAKGGVLVQVFSEIEVEALPVDLPDKLIIDVSELGEIGDSLTANKLQYDKKKVTLQLEDSNAVIVQIEEPKEEKEEAPPESETTEEAETGEEVEEGKEKGKEEEPKEEKEEEQPVKDKEKDQQKPSKEPEKKQEKQK